MPRLKAIEKLDALEVIDSSNIYYYHFTAFENADQAKAVEHAWLMKEAEDTIKRD